MLTGAWQFSSQHVLEGERIHGTLGCPSSRKVSGFYFFSILDHISAILENISSRCSFSLALTGREASIFHLCTSDAPFKMAVPVIKHTHVLASKTMWVSKTIVVYLQFPIPFCSSLKFIYNCKHVYHYLSVHMIRNGETCAASKTTCTFFFKFMA